MNQKMIGLGICSWRRLRCVLLAILALTNSVQVMADTFRVAAASSFRFVLPELLAGFHSKTGHEALVSYGASGALTAQILQGAGFDVFISADPVYADRLVKSKMTQSMPEQFAHGSLVLWTSVSELKAASDIAQWLSENPQEKIAIANPKLAPYGAAAMQYLERSGQLAKIANRQIVMTDNVAQAAQYVVNGNLRLALVSRSIAMNSKIRNGLQQLDVPHGLYDPLPNVILLLRGDNSASSQLIDYVYSSDGARVLIKHGYSPSLRVNVGKGLSTDLPTANRPFKQ